MTCLGHGPSNRPLLDRDMQKPQTNEIIQTNVAASIKIIEEKICQVHRGTFSNSTYVWDLITANGQRSKEDRKALKVETRGPIEAGRKAAEKPLENKLWKFLIQGLSGVLRIWNMFSTAMLRRA